MFLLVLCVFFLFKAIETVGYKEGEEATHKRAYGFAAIAGVILAITAITWVDYRAILVPFLVVMIIQVLVDRFKGKDPMPMALVYSITVLIAAVAAGVYYGVIGLWDQVASGSVFLAIFISALVAGFAATAKKPWTLTLPIFIVVAVAVLVALYFLMPEFFSCIVSGNPIYDEAYLATLGEQKLTLSMLSTYYGAVTYWFVYLVVLGMLYKVRKNAGSAAYIFTMVWLFVLTLTCGHNATEAAIATPVFALGFAALVCWILKHVDFKAYFSAIRTAPGKAKVRRIIRPAPFVSIIVALLLVVGPNVTYVLDASISSNDVDDYNDSVSSIIDKEPFGALSYYIKTDDSWTVRDALKDIRSDKDGSLISWMDYSADAPLYGGLSSYTDTNGKGAVTASNILLGNAINGASSAAILVNAIDYAGGMTDSVKALLSAAGISADDIIVIDNVLKDVEYKIGGKTVKYMVTTDVETYGKVTEDISDENVKYLFLTNFLAENYSQYVINEAYDLIAAEEGLSTPYIMVTGDMMPFYYGYAGVFNEMAVLNGYNVDSTNYTVSKFTQFGYYAYYYGIYGFTDAMYDTLLYRTYIGMAPAEAGFSSIYDYMIALSNADTSVVMHPGYGLGNYSVVYWQVMYNADDNATSDSDGWVQMDGNKAIAKQMTEGGRINYLSGLPVIVAYDANNTGVEVTGNVANAGKGEVRVSAIDEYGNLRATAFTDASGNYSLYVKEPAKTTLVFYAGSEGITGGVIFDTQTIPTMGGAVNSTLNNISVDIFLSYQTTPSIVESEYDVVITNSLTDEKIEKTLKDAKNLDLALGTYDVEIKKGDTKVYSGSFTTSLQATQDVIFYIDTFEYTITLRDEFKKTDLDVDEITVTGDAFTGTFDKKDGKYVINVPKGDYIVSADNVYFESPSISVSSSSSKTLDVSKGQTVSLTGISDGTIVNFVNDVHRVSAVAGTVGSVTVPVSQFGDTSYTVSYVAGNEIYYVFAPDFVGVNMVPAGGTLVEHKDISGTLKNAAGTPVSGTIIFYAENGAMFKVSADKDGKFTAYDVPKVAMLAYATNGSTEAFMGAIAADDVSEDFTMESANAISSSLSWSSVNAEYLNVLVNNIEGLAGYKLYFTVNTSGNYKFYAPASLNMDVTVELEGNMFFKKDDTSSDRISVHNLTDTVRTSPSYTLFARADATDAKNQVILIDKSGLYNTIGDEDYYLSIGSVDTLKKAAEEGFTAAASISYTLGKIATGTDTSGKYYANGTYYLNPFEPGFDFEITLAELLGYATDAEAEKAIAYQSIVFKVAGDDVISIEGDYKNGNSGATDGKEYLFLKSTIADTLVTIKNADSSKVLYLAANGLTSPVTVDLEKKVSVKGYVGIDADGTVTVEYADAKVEFDVDEGTYDLALYKGVAAQISVSVAKDGAKYTLSAPVSYTPDASGTRNFLVSGNGMFFGAVANESGNGVYKKVEVTIPANSFTNTDKSGYFAIKFGSAWESAYASVGTDIVTQIYIAENAKNVEFKVVGYYNSQMYDLCSEEMLITLDGSAYDQYVYINDVPTTEGLVYVNKLDDIVGDHAYTYVVEVNNLAGKPVSFDISGWKTGVDTTAWNIMVEQDLFGKFLKVQDITAVDNRTAIAYPGVNTYKVSFVPVSTATAVPGLNLVNEFGADFTLVTLTDSVTIDDATGKVTISATPGNAIVSATDMSASGRGVLNELSGMPTIVWVLFGLAIILAILTIWMASKRGVFARRK